MAVNTLNRALFFDLGGTLVKLDENRDLPADAMGNVKVEMLPKVVEKLKPIRDHLILIVTNQSGVARGRFKMEQIEAAIAEVDRQIGGVLTGFAVCPHRDGYGCQCRKPRAGMIEELAEIYGVELKDSTMVGDQEVDRLCAEAGGVGTFVYAHEFFGWSQ